MAKRKAYSCDFETTTKIDDCRVWAYGYMEIGKTSNYKIGNNLDEFMSWCEESKADLYFHNLKFDGEFIVHWLLKNGFTFSKTGEAKTFNTVISKMGAWYMIDICYGYKGKHKQHTAIYDSLKKLPFPVKTIGEAFKLSVLKGDIDYKAERPIGHVITEEEYSYIKNDIQIVAEALDIQFKQGLTAMTNGSDALTGFKDIISKKLFEKNFPVFSIEMDKEFRKAYKGGFTWLNKLFRERLINEGMVFDVNSLYPSVMYDRLLPYGMPIYFKGKYIHDDTYPLYIQHIRCEFEIKDKHIPTIQIKGLKHLFKGTEYLESSKGEVVDLYLTNVDLKLIEDHYHLYDVKYVAGWKMRGKSGMFKDYIDKWMAVKVDPNSPPAIVALAKLMLNSLYGKFASNPDVTGKYPYLKENGSVGYKEGDEEVKDPVYTPMGAFITAYARELTIRTAQKCYDRIIYCDTDSIHLTGKELPEPILDVIHDKKLGYWQHESNYIKAKYLRQKTYIQELVLKSNEKGKKVRAQHDDYETTKVSVKCSGMPDAVKKKVTFENFTIGFKSNGKLRPKHVNGGIVLEDSVFTLKEENYFG